MDTFKQCDIWAIHSETSDKCPFMEACARKEVAPSLARVAMNAGCWEFEKGNRCGRTTTYFESAIRADFIGRLDELAPVTHNAKIIKPPCGIAPVEVREEVVGTTVNVRSALHPEGTDDSQSLVVPLDLILALHDDGKFDAASWYMNYFDDLPDEDKPKLLWSFAASDLELQELERPRENSMREYGMFPWTRTGLGTLNSAYLLNLSQHSPNSPKGKIFYEVLQEFADEQFEGNIKGAVWAYVMSRVEWANAVNSGLLTRGRATTFNEAGEVIRIADDGMCVYDKERGIDHRDNPGDAQPILPPFSRFSEFVEQRVIEKGGESVFPHARPIANL